MEKFLTLQILVLVLGINYSCAQSWNTTCGPDNHCDVDVGLICQSSRCACSSGVFNGDYSYDLVWDAGRRLCVGRSGSVCIETRRTSLPQGMKRIECEEPLSCIQMRGAPLGIGVCKPVPKIYFHGTSCNESVYCDAVRGLVCDPTNNTCVCSKERSNTSPEYQLVWDTTLNVCVGDVGSGCFGTKSFPVPKGVSKPVGCVGNAECVQMDGATPGVGICRIEGEEVPQPSGATSVYHIQVVSTVVALGLFVIQTAV